MNIRNFLLEHVFWSTFNVFGLVQAQVALSTIVFKHLSEQPPFFVSQGWTKKISEEE